ncbi:zinc finger CCHC domain-containing protein 7-like [Periophthalmus magnuspinnatus]|uniref:zinc finger CCHC domain-containing protein 7-like n=1 Tax=Periophthalmus magnuspinnatus TaxID=409849 RepID=UPI00145BF786|nr:zinc finger CCHC domain-containing protein 7-like [Periophthalmus magnuspinnatus]
MNKDYFIEDLSSSEDDNLTCSTWKQSSRSKRDNSPPVILAFSITSERDTQGDQSCVDTDDGEQEEEEEVSTDYDETVEEWMLLDKDPQEGDSTIQLNLSFSISSDEDSDHEDKTVTLFQDQWAVSKRDKESGKQSSVCRYFTLDQSLFCPVCKKTGHLAKSCQLQKKCPVCVLCGIQGHLQKECPSRPCSKCGLLSHASRACDRLPVWNQHCQRCGLMGHLSDICPDTWRQYHYTITMTDSPIKIQTCHVVKQKKRSANCYNCSRRGHYGHECSRKRMISGTFFTLPYVCHYDAPEKTLQSRTRNNRNIEITNETPLAEQQQLFGTDLPKTFKDQALLFQRTTSMKQKAQSGGRKTWPERRRERQEVKRLRREAQAKREGLMGHFQRKPDDIDDDDDVLYLKSFGASNPWQYTSPSKKAKKTLHQRNKNSRKTQREHLKKRDRKINDFQYPFKEMDSENLPSPKQRVRHRRR